LDGINGFLSIHAAGNKSGALLLTIRSLIDRRGNERFTIRRAASAFQDGDGPIGDACRKQKLRGAKPVPILRTPRSANILGFANKCLCVFVVPSGKRACGLWVEERTRYA
jgi:hypothetical protein